MMPSNPVAHLALALVSAFALAGPSLGCTANVGGGTGGEGGDGSGTGTDTSTQTDTQTGTGTETCTAYGGDGCAPGATMPCPASMPGYPSTGGHYTCSLVPGQVCVTQWDDHQFWGPCSTPLVLSFDGAPVEYLTDREHAFDLSGIRSEVTDWPTARTPWLALDRDGNGRIDDGGELFGSMTVLSSGRRAPHGFAALRELDADGDGKITPADTGFSRLLVWSDRDGDRRSSADELVPASAWELLSIDLDYTADCRCDARGNCEVERAAFRFRDATGAVRTGTVVDVHLAAQR